jgi:hypothetical protein
MFWTSGDQEHQQANFLDLGTGKRCMVLRIRRFPEITLD